MSENTLSARMKQTIEGLLPRIAAVKDRSSTLIDLATAENWLIREELGSIYKAAIQNGLSSKV